MNFEFSLSGDLALSEKKTPLQTLVRVRNNQRRHRERRRQHIASLEQKVQDTERQLNQALTEIASLRTQLARCEFSHGHMRSALAGGLPSEDTSRAGSDGGGDHEVCEGGRVFRLRDHTGSTPIPMCLPVSKPEERDCSIKRDPSLVLEVEGQQGGVDGLPTSFTLQSDAGFDDASLISSSTVLGVTTSNPSIPESPFSPASCSRYPPADEQATTSCLQAYVVISQLNFRGLDPDSITAWLNPGFRRSRTLHDGCQVESKLLFELLDFISESDS
jgi:hypothetical protein